MLRLTRDEYYHWAENQKGRFERIGGEPIAMSSQPVAHVRLKACVWAALDRAIRENNLDCEALGDGITVEIGDDTDYEPDAVVNCGPLIHPDATVAPNPVVVVEVLSPATQSIDTGDKLADYFRVPSVQHYLVVRARRQEIIHHQRRGDEIISRPIHVGIIRLDPPGITLDVAEIYAIRPA